MPSSTPFPSDFRCSLRSLDLDEPLFATATETQVYFLLEYNQAWGAKAFEEGDLPEAVKAHLKLALKQIPGARLLMIKNRSSRSTNVVHFFAAQLSDREPSLYAFQLQDYTDLLDLDLPTLVSSSERYSAYRRQEPLCLVCTNGRRDPCCAAHGTAIFRSLSRSPGINLWQTSHVGGHRFAANLVYLPYGLFFGRLDLLSAERVTAALQRGELVLDHFRGRACYAKPVQAAEYYLRRQTGLSDVDAFHLIQAEQTSSQEWRMILAATKTPAQYVLEILRQESDVSFFHSCRQDKLSPLVRYHLLSLRQLR
jgi:hypothetical protein